MLAPACDKLDTWRDGQVQQSQQISQGSKVEPPAQPVAVPNSVRGELPLDDGFIVLSYHDGSGGTRPPQPGLPPPPAEPLPPPAEPPSTNVVTLTALSPWNAEQTALWLVTRLGELGYDSGDNASRMLEGATYTRERGAYRTLFVKLSLNTAGQCTVEYRASR